MIREYESFVKELAARDGDPWLVECALGLGGEAGEVQEKIKKLFRDGANPLDNGLLGELGDTLYYLTALANHFDLTLEDVMRENMAKLYSRKERGVLKGSGSDR